MAIAKRLSKNQVAEIEHQQDARDDLKPGDRAAVLWYDDPDYYVGTVEKFDGELVMQLPWDTLGQLEIAHHVVKISKA